MPPELTPLCAILPLVVLVAGLRRALIRLDRWRMA